jgi:ubiquinone/menaquinone biosynthesis C-methylase UbiE
MFKNVFQEKVKIIDGIYSIIDEKYLTGDNLKYHKFYNKIAWVYTFLMRTFFFFKFGGEKNFREQFLKDLNIIDSNKVLEVSIGTADNIRFLNRNAEYFGLDISIAMLRQAKRHLKKWNINSKLILGEGENLPFNNNFFDCVFHVGGINFFNDKQKAISEMIRVAKPGTRLLIVDETDKWVKESYQKNILFRNEFKDAGDVSIPIKLIPDDMKDIKIEIICKGLMYKITFIKP